MPLLAFNRKDTGGESIGSHGRQAADLPTIPGNASSMAVSWPGPRWGYPAAHAIVAGQPIPGTHPASPYDPMVRQCARARTLARAVVELIRVDPKRAVSL